MKGQAGVQVPFFDASNLRQQANLGDPWLVKGGDNPAYAQPGFDDSSWIHYDANTSLKQILPGVRPEVVWYRMHVKCAPDETGLALAETQLANAFEVYVDGQRIMQSGQVSPYRPYTANARLLAPISDRFLASGKFTIALRVHLSPKDWSLAYPGFWTFNLALGQKSTLQDHNWLDVIGTEILNWLLAFSAFGASMVALAFFIAQPRQREYLWIFLQFLSQVLLLLLFGIQAFQNIPALWVLLGIPIFLPGMLFSVLIYLAMLRISFSWPMRTIVAIAGAGVAYGALIGLTTNNVSDISGFIAGLPYIVLTGIIIPLLLITHWRRGNREAGILLIPAILSSSATTGNAVLGIVQYFPALGGPAQRWASIYLSKAGPFVLDPRPMSNLLYVLSLCFIMVLRSTRTSRQQVQLEGELAAAREIQRVILPAQIESVPGFKIESVYQPAREVGGDFFQILPTGEGTLLVIIGDVAGKGMPAAMTVSLIVGTLRILAESTSCPGEILAKLSRHLHGRGRGGFTTCLALFADRDGTITIANAGHIPPYKDGKEILVEPGLPLGVISDTVYSETVMKLNENQQLTLVTDGVVEARNKRGGYLGSSAQLRSRAGPHIPSLKPPNGLARMTT